MCERSEPRGLLAVAQSLVVFALHHRGAFACALSVARIDRALRGHVLEERLVAFSTHVQEGEARVAHLDHVAVVEHARSHGTSVDAGSVRRGQITDHEVRAVEHDLRVQSAHVAVVDVQVGLGAATDRATHAIERERRHRAARVEPAATRTLRPDADLLVHGDERGPRAHDRPAEREFAPFGLHRRRAQIAALRRFGEALHTAPRPGPFEPPRLAAHRGNVHRQLLPVGPSVGREPGDHQRARAAPFEAPEEPQRFARLKVGHGHGFEVAQRRALPVHRDVREHGTRLAHAPSQTCEHLLRARSRGHRLARAAARPRHPRREPRVGPVTHRGHVELRAAEQRRKPSQKPSLVAHGHVAHEHHDARSPFACGHLRGLGERGFELRTSPRRAGCDERVGLRDELRRERRERIALRVHHLDGVVEDREAHRIARRERREHGGHHGAHLRLASAHRGRAIDEHAHVSRPRRTGDHIDARRQHRAAVRTRKHRPQPRNLTDRREVAHHAAAVAAPHGAHVALAASALRRGPRKRRREREQKGSHRALAAIEPEPRAHAHLRGAPGEHEVAVLDGRIDAQPHGGASLRIDHDGDEVRGRGEILDGVLRFEGHVDRHVVAAGALQRARGGVSFGARVRGRRRHGEREAPLSVVVGEKILVRELDVDHRAGREVRDGEREERGAIFFEERRGAPFGEGLLVGAAGLFLRLDHGLDDAVFEAKAHRVHRGLGRQRKAVHGLDGHRAVVAKALVHRHIREGSGDVGLDDGAFEGQRCAVGTGQRALRHRRLDGLFIDDGLNARRTHHDAHGRRPARAESSADQRAGPSAVTIAARSGARGASKRRIAPSAMGTVSADAWSVRRATVTAGSHPSSAPVTRSQRP